MPRRLPPLNALRAFEAAARHLSFTRAANELSVTQAAISHQIKGLEDFLGLPLFRRLNRALLLTREGQVLFPAVRDALDSLADTTERLRTRNQGGALTVSSMPSFAVKWLVPRMSHFQDRHPDIDLRIAANERISEFARDGIDVAVRFGKGGWTGVRADLLAEETVQAMCSPSLLPHLRTPADLARMTLLHEEMAPLPDFPTWADWLTMFGLTGNVDATRGPRFSHSHMMLQAAIDGRGVCLGQTLLAADDLASGRLVAPFASMPPTTLPTGYGYYVVCPQAAADRPKIKAFREWVMAEIASVGTAPV